MVAARSLLSGLAVLTSFASAGRRNGLRHTRRAASMADFNWTSITPSRDLRYYDCSDWYQCARLELPLDWNATEGDAAYGKKYEMAVVRIPARVPITDSRYGGAVLYNPGGPGSSGTASISQNLQAQLDAAYSYNSTDYVSPDPRAKYFDVMYFDPRGVGASTPYYVCGGRKSLPAYDQFYDDLSVKTLNWPGGNLQSLWQYNLAESQSCYWDPVTNPDGPLIANFSSTAMTARDMVELVERHGEWRQNQANTARDRRRLE